ncbi:hypothetical protein LIER_42125 [Lithospermum erythrorhizon]|uniref:Uncharacterized protein n=1 Tax=Lithospermum erythrorhizon TaxID=34254 RepID=A0AAV3RN83_LITER
MGTKLDDTHKEALISLIREFEDVFSWGPKDMPGVDTKARAILELQFPEWIANVVLVKKPNNKWRMYTDFTSLNKACPKDFYPLPYLGRLVDGTAGHEIFAPRRRGENGLLYRIWPILLESHALWAEKRGGY